LKNYRYKVLAADVPAGRLEQRMNRLARQGYGMLAVSSQGKLIIMAREKRPDER
jgi:hypothetical protein